jgi:type I restriction enzyme, S subunit
MTDLPSGWAETTLHSIAAIVRGVTYDKSEAVGAPAKGLLPILRATNIERTLNLNSAMVYVPEQRVKPAQRMRPGDIVIAASSGSLSVVGKSAPLLTSWEGGFGAFCAVVRPEPAFSKEYLSYFVSSPRVRKTWRDLAQGTNINNLKGSDLGSTTVPVPPRAEQERIVAAIEEEFSRIDAGVAALNGAEKRLQRMRNAVVEAAISGHLNDDHREQLVDAPTLPSWPDTPFGAPVGIPHTWSWVRIASLEPELQNGEASRGDPTGQPTVVLRLADIHDGAISLTSTRELGIPQASRAKYRLTRGDILVIRVNGSRDLVGQFILCTDNIDGIYCDHFIRMRVNANVIWPPFLSLLGSSRVTRRQVERSFVSTAGQLTVNQDHIRSLVIPLPPLAEQREIVSLVDRYLALVADLRRPVRASLVRASHLRAAVLNAAFTGKLVPQDLSDEPASVLLERTASDRASFNDDIPTRDRTARSKVTA